MEIRCEQCEHVGAAASVVPGANGIELVCANCGHHNVLDVPGQTPAPRPKPKPKPSPDTSQDAWLTKGALERLIPQEGRGPRCRKCAQLLDEDEPNCPRCGLNVAEGARYAEDAAPWDRPPEGLEAAFEQATLLWKAVAEHPSDENLGKFAAFVREEDLLEYGIRRLRFFLVEHPGDDRAVTYLEELAESFQAKMIVARAKAEVRAGNIVAATGRAKTLLLWLVFVMWIGILALFLGKFGGC